MANKSMNKLNDFPQFPVRTPIMVDVRSFNCQTFFTDLITGWAVIGKSPFAVILSDISTSNMIVSHSSYKLCLYFACAF